MSLDREAVVVGTAAEELLGMYQISGHRVIVLGSYCGEEIAGSSFASDVIHAGTSASGPSAPGPRQASARRYPVARRHPSVSGN